MEFGSVSFHKMLQGHVKGLGHGQNSRRSRTYLPLRYDFKIFNFWNLAAQLLFQPHNDSHEGAGAAVAAALNSNFRYTILNFQ